MSLSTYTPTLVERVLAQLEDPPIGYHWVTEKVSEWSPLDRDLTDDDYVIRDWGLIYGVAYGIARSEDPFEPNHHVAARAFDAARAAHDRYAGTQ